MRVHFLSTVVNGYRVRFHDLAQDRLAQAGVDYRVVAGRPSPNLRSTTDSVLLPHYREIRNLYPRFLGREFVVQLLPKDVLDCDLLILQQENKLLTNYGLQTLHRSKARKIAFWGHGRSFSAPDGESASERWKRFWARRVDWWFAYTEDGSRHIASLGFPRERITVFNNAVDTRAAARLAAAVTPGRLAARKIELGLSGTNIAVFVGGLYAEKRLDVLIGAADRLRAAIPDFELLIIGNGAHTPLVKEAASSRPWLKALGARFGTDKAELMAMAKVFLMPGLVGLALLDAGAAGLPVITTDYPFHSPEIAYLKEGESGLVARPWTSVDAYADMVADLLTGDPRRLASLAQGARRMAEAHTIEAMAERFTTGVLRALGKENE